VKPRLAKVSVNRKAADRLEAGHPWIFRSDVTSVNEAGRGDAVDVVDARGRTLGTAHYSSTSNIALRMLSDRAVEIDRAFFEERIAAAGGYRRRVVENSDAYRMVFGEADSLPGLVIDRYGDSAVVQTLSQGMDRGLETIAGILVENYGVRRVVARNDVAVRRHEDLPIEKKMVRGEPCGAAQIAMNGYQWSVDLLEGQKTGIFLDQRENYLAAARWARGRGLDCFTCTGGFALHLARGCDSVEGVDSSAAALETARENARRNDVTNVEFRQADLFDLLAGYVGARRVFDTIVLDPPAFAKDRRSVDQALGAYREINQRALRLMSRDGVLVTCSCSHHVSEAALLEAVAHAASDAGKRLRVIERRFQAGDHPVLLSVPETLYLKCLIVGPV
jgi:23S rRNA (cytosine1962-C5)-methyltransferase